MEGGGWCQAARGERRHEKSEICSAPAWGGRVRWEQLGTLCQNEHSSFPNLFAAIWPCPLPCADLSTHLRSVRTDARQEHGARKGEGLGERPVTLEETCPEQWHQKEQASWATKVSIQQMTPHLKQEAHFPPQLVRKNSLLTTWEHPIHLFFFSFFFLIPLFPSITHLNNKLWNPEMPSHGKWKMTLITSQPSVLLCSQWEDPALLIGGILWQRDLEQDHARKHWHSHFHVGSRGTVYNSGKFLIIF